jgi:hypothetical protein
MAITKSKKKKKARVAEDVKKEEPCTLLVGM